MRTSKEFDDWVTPVTETSCLIWLGRVDRHNYGIYRFAGQIGAKAGGKDRRREISAHRYALERALGRPLLPGMYACHTCDVRLCVNPSHLYEGSPQDNANDRRTRGASPPLVARRRRPRP